MQIGTYARDLDQVRKALEFEPDFVDLRMDLTGKLNLTESRKLLSDAGVGCTVHLPNSPDWGPIDVARGIVPFIDMTAHINAELVTFHTTLSPLFFSDEDIAAFLHEIPAACDAAREAGVILAAETLGLYFTELTLLFDIDPDIRLAMDIGHAQILAARNRSLGMIEHFFDKIAMANCHDNHGKTMVDEVLRLRSQRELPLKEMRSIGHKYDEHLPMGEGSIDFDQIFRELKRRSYDGRFLMMCRDQTRFPDERRKLRTMWDEA